MAKPKPEQQPASMPDQAGVTGAGAPDAAPPAMGGRDAMTETAEGAVPASGGASADTGAGLGDPAPVRDVVGPGEQVVVDRAVTAHLYDAAGNLLQVVTKSGSGADAMTPAELADALGIGAAEVYGLNLDTRTIVTRDGQKHRLA